MSRLNEAKSSLVSDPSASPEDHLIFFVVIIQKICFNWFRYI